MIHHQLEWIPHHRCTGRFPSCSHTLRGCRLHSCSYTRLYLYTLIRPGWAHVLEDTGTSRSRGHWCRSLHDTDLGPQSTRPYPRIRWSWEQPGNLHHSDTWNHREHWDTSRDHKHRKLCCTHQYQHTEHMIWEPILIELLNIYVATSHESLSCDNKKNIIKDVRS